MRPGIGLRFELAAVSKRLDGEKATVFPAPVGAATRTPEPASMCAQAST